MWNRTMSNPRCAWCSKRSTHLEHTYGETGKLCLACWIDWCSTTDRWKDGENGARRASEAADATQGSKTDDLMFSTFKRSDAL